jgi:hypothetical protein
MWRNSSFNLSRIFNTNFSEFGELHEFFYGKITLFQQFLSRIFVPKIPKNLIAKIDTVISVLTFDTIYRIENIEDFA